MDRPILVSDGDSTTDLRFLKWAAAKAIVVAPALAALATTALFLWLFLRLQWRIGDEGTIVYGAARVADGAIPSRDFFEVMGPGTFYWLALWFKAFGTTWLTSRVAILATALVSASAIYYVAERQCRSKWAALPAVLYTLVTVPSWPGANHHFDSNMWALLAFAASVSAPQFNRKMSVLTGVFAGFASTIMPQKGVLLLAGVCIGRVMNGGTWRDVRRTASDTLWVVVPFLLVGATVILFFWFHDALSDLVYANLIWPATHYHSVNVVPYAHNLREVGYSRIAPVMAALLPSPISSVATALAVLPFVLVAVLPFAAVALLLSAEVARTGARTQAIRVPWSYWCAGFALFASEFHRADLMHLAYGSPLLLIAVVARLTPANGSLAVMMRRTLACSVALLAIVLALVGMTPATTMKTRSGEIQLLGQDEALDFLHEHVRAGEQVFVYPYYPMYYFLANVHNPTRYSILMYHINTPTQFEEVIRNLETGQVRYVLWDTAVAGANLTQWFPGYQDPPASEQRLERYFEEKYKVVGFKNRFRILERI